VTAEALVNPGRERSGSVDLLRGEQWLLRRLLQHQVDALAGVTEAGGRKARFRAAIQLHGLDVIICGTRDGKPVTYAQAFQRLYGERL